MAIPRPPEQTAADRARFNIEAAERRQQEDMKLLMALIQRMGADQVIRVASAFRTTKG